MATETYAKRLIGDLDKNGNKVLDGDELAKLKEPARSADFNQDGYITQEELVARLSNPSAKSASLAAPSAKSGTEPASDSSGGDRDAEDGRDEQRPEARRGDLFGLGRGESD